MNAENEVMAKAKLVALEVLDSLLNFEEDHRLEACIFLIISNISLKSSFAAIHIRLQGRVFGQQSLSCATQVSLEAAGHARQSP